MKFSATSGSGNRYFLQCWLCALLLFLLACPAKTGESAYMKRDQNTPTDLELKAIYLYNFLKFIKWPQDKCDLHEGRSRHISVLGESSFNQVLRTLQKKLNKDDTELEVTFYGPFKQGMEFPCCCLLFINDTELDNIEKILAKLEGMPVLTVADADTFMNKGGMISLIEQNNKIRWMINRRPINQSGLQLSAKLYDIALWVIEE